MLPLSRTYGKERPQHAPFVQELWQGSAPGLLPLSGKFGQGSAPSLSSLSVLRASDANAVPLTAKAGKISVAETKRFGDRHFRRRKQVKFRSPKRRVSATEIFDGENR